MKIHLPKSYPPTHLKRRLWITFPALICAISLHAADPAPKPKSRTLKELVELAVKEGVDKKIDQHTSENLGLSPKETPVKRLRYKSNETSDKREHTFNVVYFADNNNVKPVTLIWTIDKSTTTNEGKLIDGRGFRSSLDGKLQNAMKVTGIVGQLEQQQLSASTGEVKKNFNKELDFWLKRQ